MDEKKVLEFQIRRLSSDTVILMENRTSYGGFIQFQQQENQILQIELIQPEIINEIQDNLDLICLMMTCRSFYLEFKEQYKDTLRYKDIEMFESPSKGGDFCNHLYYRSQLPYPMKSFTSFVKNALANQLVLGEEESNVLMKYQPTFDQSLPTVHTAATTNVNIIPVTNVFIEEECFESRPPTTTKRLITAKYSHLNYLAGSDWMPPELEELMMWPDEESPTFIDLPDTLRHLHHSRIDDAPPDNFRFPSSLVRLKIESNCDDVPVVVARASDDGFFRRLRSGWNTRHQRSSQTRVSQVGNLEKLTTDVGTADQYHFLDSLRHLVIGMGNAQFGSSTIRLPKKLESLEARCLISLPLSLPTTLTSLHVADCQVPSLPLGLLFLRVQTMVDSFNGHFIGLDMSVLPASLKRLELDLVSSTEPLRIDDILSNKCRIVNLVDDNLDLVCLLMTCKSFYIEFKEKYKDVLQFKDIMMIDDPPFTKRRCFLFQEIVDRTTQCYPMQGFESLFQNALAGQLVNRRDESSPLFVGKSSFLSTITITSSSSSSLCFGFKTHQNHGRVTSYHSFAPNFGHCILVGRIMILSDRLSY
ncbi:hypothetical protein DFA_10728 [Cavenderia fasciculata]|uniref:Uncharacterized protein n=1 Tax=Cavenderia fasciculata TaxID=261658 RepID=F4QB83_CACFS|nr:uncharacterized protein DFA_10728 [Cavenderia fasciculata]EGG14855.1 hypothetical protein DFA_10728 [Cavenderia fasciculata]|eukprot:XP_004351371.1 hypothetical protein DFA_10728 [Cavenderia fasciculata]